MEKNKAVDCPACTFGIPQEGVRISWEITHRCNFNCKHCCVNAKPDLKEHYSLSAINRIMRDFHEAGVKKMYLTGGEPLMFEHIKPLMELGSKLDINMKIATNGSSINRNVAKELKKYNIYSILVSIDSPSPVENNKFRGNDEAYIVAVKAINNLVRNGIKVKVSTVLWKGNIDKIEDMILLSIALGAYKQYFSWVIPVGRVEDNIDILVTNDEFKETRPKLIKLIDKYKDRIEIHVRRTEDLKISGKICPGADKLYHIDDKGFVYPCSWMAKADSQFKSKTSIIKNNIGEILSNDLNLIKFRNFVKDYSSKYGPGCPAIVKLTEGCYNYRDELFE